MTLPEAEFHNLWFYLIAQRLLNSQNCSFKEHSLTFTKDLFSKFGMGISNAVAAREFDAYMATYRRHWSLYSDVRPCLDAIAHCELGVISNGDREFQLSKLEKLGLAQRFSPVVLSADIGCAKPDSGIFAEACARAGAAPADCIYVGDHLQTDVAASIAAGWRAVWINRREQQEQISGARSIATLAELPSVIADFEARPCVRIAD